ncbi:MAG: polyphosphate polymerase domain-containing protein [Parasporobacterium sp.]|nr:polyphosphate polymerase domain-containing protein [Parasporobacterium sp.]
MEKQGKYRHEQKYMVSPAEYMSIRQRIRTLMKPDEHAGTDGRYTIRSIYFDNAEDKALREKTDGIQKREKYRIRYYNDDFSVISLEKKMKVNNLCMKFSTRLTETECRGILEGRTEWMLSHSDELVRELYYRMKSQQLRPKVLVSYTREPYVYAPGNVRVTFDSDVRTTVFHQRFLEDDVKDISAADTPEDMILEVKWDEFLPGIIEELLHIDGIRQQAFSKYGACRKYG